MAGTKLINTAHHLSSSFSKHSTFQDTESLKTGDFQCKAPFLNSRENVHVVEGREPRLTACLRCSPAFVFEYINNLLPRLPLR